MNKKLLAAAIAAASLTGFSQGSYAGLAPTDVPDIEIYMAGATAQDKAIKALFMNLCGPVTTLNPAGGSQSQDLSIFNTSGHTAYFCTLNTKTAANPNGIQGLSKMVGGVLTPVTSAKVLFHKRSAGGSAQGVNPLVAGTAIAHMPVNAVNCATAPVIAAGVPDTYACTTTANQLSDAGISDVEPLMFRGLNTPTGGAPITAASDALLTKQSAAALLFGVPVTTPLYVALQKAQGILLKPNCTIPGTYSEECMPSLSKQQVAMLMSGQVKKWSEIKNAAGLDLIAIANDAAATATYPAGVTTFVELDGGLAKNIAPTDTKFHYCKRIEGSGTGAVQYATFLNAPCSDTAMDGDFATSSVNGPVKHELSGSGDMDKCLSDFADKTNTGLQWTSGTSFTTAVNTALASGWAIGQQSLENNAGAIPARHYRFVKIDGVAPTLANAFSGKYYDWAEPTYQWRTTGALAPTGDKLPIIQKIASDAASPAIIASDLNPGFNHAFGQSGYLANGKVFPITATLNPLLPVMPYTHAPGTAATSACRVPVMQSTATIKPL